MIVVEECHGADTLHRGVPVGLEAWAYGHFVARLYLLRGGA